MKRACQKAAGVYAHCTVGRLCSATARIPARSYAHAAPLTHITSSVVPHKELVKISSSDKYLQQMTPAEICLNLKKLQADVYSKLSYLPWLQLSNVTVAYIQLVKNRKLEQLMAPVVEHPGFKAIEKEVQRRMAMFSHADLLQIYLSLQRLGVDRASPVLRDAFVEVLDRVRHSKLTLAELRDLLLVLQDHGPVPTIIPHLCTQLRSSLQLAEPNSESAVLLADISLLMRKTLPAATSQAVKQAFSDVIGRCKDDPIPTASHLRTYMRMGLKVTMATDGWQESSNDNSLRAALASCIPSIIRRAQTLDAGDLALTAACLRRWSLFSNDIQTAFQERVRSLLEGTEMSCSELSGLLEVLFSSPHMQPLEVRSHATQLVVKKLPEADVLLTLRFINVLAQPHVVRQLGPEALVVVRNILLANFDTLFSVPSKLSVLLNFAAMADASCPYDEVWTSAFITRLTELLDKSQYGASTFAMCEISCYLLPLCHKRNRQALESLVARLMLYVPQMRVPSAARLKRALNRALANRPQRGNDAELYRLDALLFQHGLRDIGSLSAAGGFPLLHYVARNVLTKDYASDARLQQERLAAQLMPQFRDHIPGLQPAYVLQLINLCREIRYYDGQTLASLEKRLYSSESEMRHIMMPLLRLFSLVGYTPANMSRFLTACEQLQSFLTEEMKPSDRLTLAYDLACIQCFPRDLLISMFTVRFLSELEDELQRMSASLLEGYRRQLMCLNRAIVLEASPDLGIPWFHNDFSFIAHRSIDENAVVSRRFFADVDNVLATLIGRHSYVTGSVTPYFHKIDFELALVKGRVVNASQLGSLPADAKRVAIMLLSDYACCTHSNKLIGYVESTLRQLSLLGHTVVKIHRNEWVGSSHSTSYKEHTLRTRIFDSN